MTVVLNHIKPILFYVKRIKKNTFQFCKMTIKKMFKLKCKLLKKND